MADIRTPIAGADHYENLYAVIRGYKVFHLLPPSDVYRMALQAYPAAKYDCVDGQLQPVLLQPPYSVLWCPIDPKAAKDRSLYPLYFDDSLPKPLRVVIGPGELLYLPAMWYHYVEQQPDPQQDWVIAVNYW